MAIKPGEQSAAGLGHSDLAKACLARCLPLRPQVGFVILSNHFESRPQGPLAERQYGRWRTAIKRLGVVMHCIVMGLQPQRWYGEEQLSTVSTTVAPKNGRT